MASAGKAALAFATGFGGGYMGAKRQAEQDEERRQDRAAAKEERDLRMRQLRREEDAQIALANASRPVTMEEGAGGMIRPASADDRDVGLADGPALQQGGFRVDGKTYADRQQADVALARANAPEAVRGRQVAALNAAGKPVEAIGLQNAATGAQLNEMQLAQQKFARDAAQAIMGGGWDGAAKFMSESKADGNQYQVRPDGKGNVTVVQVNPQTGEARPVRTYQDSDAGRMSAFNDLLAAVNPQATMQHYRWTQEQERRGKEFDETKAFQREQLASQQAYQKAQLANSAASIGLQRENLEENRKMFKRQGLDGQVSAVEDALGRPLGKDERESMVLRLAGIGKADKGDEAVFKFADDIVKESVKAGTMTADQAPAARQKIVAQVAAERTAATVREGLARAKADGKLPEAIAELRRRGLNDEQIRTLAGDIAPAAQPSTAAARPTAAAPVPVPQRPLPRSLGEVPGVQDAGRVTRGTDLIPAR